MKSIAVIGQGFVGGSLTTVFSEKGCIVYTYDKAGKQAPGGSNPKNSNGYASTVLSVKELVEACEIDENFSNVYFVCLPTPMFDDGEADLSIIDDVLQQLAEFPRKKERIAVIKSTVPPGSTEGWNKKFSNTGLKIVFNPEFLTERTALHDMRNQNRVILGGEKPWINIVKEIYCAVFADVPIIKTSSTNAEMVKYLINCFFATKVSFANEMAQICEALELKGLNVDYDKVVEYASYDKRLGPTHWKVPGPDGDRGFGGHCFPKDINALMYLAKSLNVNPKVLNGAWEKNQEIRKDRNWERQIGRAVSFKSKTIKG